MKQPEVVQGKDRRRGVALIVVLGFLSVMILMAVAFLTHARVERMVSDVTLEGMRGRQLVRTALNAAMNDYSVELADQDLIMPQTNTAYDLFTSVPPTALMGMGGRAIGEDGIQLLVGEVFDWIPRKYTNAPYYALDTVTNDAEWILVREDPTQVSRILGRYAYAIFDMSGGIDANLVARESGVANSDGRVASNRVRRSVRQVPMGLLPETADASTFKSYRKGWKGFDSLYSLIKLTDGYPNDGNAGSDTRWHPDRKEGAPPAGLHSNLVTDLVPFSLSTWRGGSFSTGPNTWSPYELVNDSTAWPTVLAPIASQFGGAVPGWINNAIYDYTHNTAVPAGVDYPSPKNVPMFNEIAGTWTVTETPGVGPSGESTYLMDLRLTFEFWYPFPSDDNGAGAAAYQLTGPTVAGGYSPVNAQVFFRFNRITSGTNTYEPGFNLADATPTPGALVIPVQFNNGRPYTTASAPSNFHYTIQLRDMATGTPNLPPGISNIRILGARVMTPMHLTTGGQNADRLPSGLTFTPRPAVLAASGDRQSFAMAVTDPRLNHETGQWVDENNGNGTLGQMNTWDPATVAKYKAEGTNLYCRNGPMHSPGELGYISAGTEWETIDICTPAAVDVLANLTTDTNLYATWQANGVYYTNGTINPNTRSSNVLAAAFVDLTTHEAPGVDSTVIAPKPLDSANAQVIAKEIMAVTSTGTYSTAFQAGCEWARIPAMQKNGALSAFLNNNQRESLVRNTWGLFSPANSLFTVVVVAQPIKEAPNTADPVGVWNPSADMITGERRAVALVWRDPFRAGSNLHHEMFVRMFRYLND